MHANAHIHLKYHASQNVSRCIWLNFHELKLDAISVMSKTKKEKKEKKNYD